MKLQENKESATDDSRAQVQTLLLKLAPEILDVTHKLQSVLNLKAASKKFHKSKKNKSPELNLELENLYVMSTAVEKTCEAWKQPSLEMTLLSENSSSIIDFFLHILTDLYEAHPHSKILFKLEIRLFNLIDKIYDLLGKPITLYLSQLRSKYYQALYFFSQEEIDTQAAILALTNVLLFNSHHITHQLEKIYVLDILSLSYRNIINLRKIPQQEQFWEIFLNFSREMMTKFLQFPTPDSKTYSGIVNNVLEVAIFCQKDRKNVEDLISGLHMLITANKLTALSEQQCVPPLQLIIKFINTSELRDAAWLSLLLINIGEQLVSRISTPRVIGYRSILAGCKQKYSHPQTRNVGSTVKIILDPEKFSVLKPRIIKNIIESENLLCKIHQKKKYLEKSENSNDDKSSVELLPILESLTKLGDTIRKFPKGLEAPDMLKQIPVFFLHVISYLDTMPEYNEFQFKLDLFDCIEEILSLFSIDSKVQFFQFQCYFLKIRELLFRTNPDIEKMKVLVEKLTVDSCDRERLNDHQLLIFGVCESYIRKFNHLKIPQTQDKFIPIITSLAQKIIHIHEKNPDRIVETVYQILMIASFFLCLKGSKSEKSPLIQKATEGIVLNLNRIVLNYEKSNAPLPSMEECLSILTRLNKIIAAAESLNKLDLKLLNWLLQTGKVFFLKKLYHHADLSKFQGLLNKQQETQTCELLHEEKTSEVISSKNIEIKQQEQKVRDIPLKIPEKQDSPIIDTMQKEINQKNAELLNLRNKNETLKKEVRTLNFSLTKNSKKYETAVTQIEDLNKKTQASEQRILQLEQDLAKSEKQLLAQKTEYATQARLNEKIIPELKNEIKKGGEVQNDLRFICHSLTLDKTELQKKLEILTRELRKQKQDNSQMLQKHNQTLHSHEAEIALIIQKYEAEKKADERAKTKQLYSLHEEIARLKIKAGEDYDPSPSQTSQHQEISFQQEFRPWYPNFQFASGPVTYVSFSPPDSENEEQVCDF